MMTISQAQQDLQFRQLTVAQGLNDGFISAIGQDRYGFMWFASLGGLNRYNGNSMRFYHHTPGDTLSPHSGLALALASDSSGRFWIGFENGLMEYDFSTARFRDVPAMRGHYFNKILPVGTDLLLLGTNRGLFQYQPSTNKIIPFSKDQTDSAEGLFKAAVFDITCTNNKILIAGWGGLYTYEPTRGRLQRIRIKGYENEGFKAACYDARDDLWMALAGETKLLKKNPDNTIIDYSGQIGTNAGAVRNNVNGLLRDRSGDVWVITNHDGLLRYNTASTQLQKFIFQQGMPNTLSENLTRSIFEDRNGTIWIGGNTGCNYTQPRKAFFTTVLPFPDSLDIRNRRIAKASI